MLSDGESDGMLVPVSLKINPQLLEAKTTETLRSPSHGAKNVTSSTTPADVTATHSGFFGTHPLRILVAPSGFKESLGPESVAEAKRASFFFF